MNDFQPLMSVFAGFVCIFIIVSLVRTVRSYYVFKASFYPEIYSGFFEFLIRKKNLKRMSQSYWLENQLGFHRIMYQVTKTQDESLQPYILILLSTGLYVIQIYNESAHYICKNQKFKKITENENNQKIVHNLPYPLNEFHRFQTHFQKLIDNQSLPTIFITAFTDTSVLDISLQDTLSVYKKDLISTIIEYHQHHTQVFDVDDIDNIYQVFIKKTSY